MKASLLIIVLQDIMRSQGDVEIVARDVNGRMLPVQGAGRACLKHHHIAAPMLGCNADGKTWCIDVGQTP